MFYLSKSFSHRFLSLLAPALAAFLAACGGGGGSSPPPPPVNVTVTYDVSLAAADVVAGSTSTATGTATVTQDVTDGTIAVSVMVSGLDADAVSLKRGLAGETGDTLYSLTAGASAGTWTLGAQPLPTADAALLDSGALYLVATSTSLPDGALRGQVAPVGLEVVRIALSPNQVTSPGNAAASGRAWVTVDERAGSAAARVVVMGLDDADSATLHQALAGDSGPVLETLSQDPANAGHWRIDNVVVTAALDAAASAGALYFELTSPSFANGALRGQWIPEVLELVETDLTAADVVMSGTTQTSGSPAGRLMTTIDGGQYHAHLNLFAVADADAVEIRQAPAGQNGPVLAAFAQDANDANHWLLVDQSLDATMQAALDNRALYVQVTTPSSPAGAARGQIETAASMLPPDDSAFLVQSITPANASEVSALPAEIGVTFNRAPLAASVTTQAVVIEASGGDGSFGDGNEVTITPSVATPAVDGMIISLAGVSASPDVYRTTLSGGGANGIVDTSGIPLDGDADGTPGGSFTAAFELVPVALGVTFTQIQNEILTPTCATAGCHSGNSPPDGLNLEAGMAYSNMVNVAAVQMPSLLRIDPGNPDDSYLVRKIEGVGIVANRMPLGAPPLSAAQIALVRQWVTEGAPDN